MHAIKGDFLQIAELMSAKSSKTAFLKRITESMSGAKETVDVITFNQSQIVTFRFYEFVKKHIVYEKILLKRQYIMNEYSLIITREEKPPRLE